jgi:hypothetical protein
MLKSLYPQGKKPQYPLDRRLGGPQSWSERGVVEEESLPLLGIKPYSSSLQPDHYTD